MGIFESAYSLEIPEELSKKLVNRIWLWGGGEGVLLHNFVPLEGTN